VRITNAFAPEHVSIATREPGNIAACLNSSGAIFLGHFSPVAAGDFLAGPSHTLPTGGAGKSFAGLTVDQFQRRTSIVRYDREALARSMETIAAFGKVEGLDAHTRSASIRLEP
jgi:histidinol dehydrogenase